MSMHPTPIPPIPAATAQVARAALPATNRYLLLRDLLVACFRDEEFAALYPHRGQPAAPPWRLALVTLFQFAERLPDRAAAEAVASRIDWKYALALPLDAPGFDHTVLSEFRTRLLDHGAERLLFDRLLAHLAAQGWLPARGRQRTDATHVVAAVRALNRLELVRETVREVLTVVARVDPAWLVRHIPPAWGERYAGRSDSLRLPTGEAARQRLAEQIGADGQRLLDLAWAPGAPPWLRALPALEVLRHVWVQNYAISEAGRTWRTEALGLPPAGRRVRSPHDPEARLAQKRTTVWVGYKAHLTETCAPDRPQLITAVCTTPAPVADGAVLEPLHAALRQHARLPAEHLVDGGYVSAATLLRSRQRYGVHLVGPPGPRRASARQAAGFGPEHFRVDWARRQAQCPSGRTSTEWAEQVSQAGTASISIRFHPRDCGPCAQRAACLPGTRARQPRRRLVVRPQAEHEALQAQRAAVGTAAFGQVYALRAGVEGTLAQGVRRCGLRRARYVGERRTRLEHLLIGAALNVLRVADWLSGQPRARTRLDHFAHLLTPSPNS